MKSRDVRWARDIHGKVTPPRKNLISGRFCRRGAARGIREEAWQVIPTGMQEYDGTGRWHAEGGKEESAWGLRWKAPATRGRVGEKRVRFDFRTVTSMRALSSQFDLPVRGREKSGYISGLSTLTRTLSRSSPRSGPPAAAKGAAGGLRTAMTGAVMFNISLP